MTSRTVNSCDGNVKQWAIGAPAPHTSESLRERFEQVTDHDPEASLRIEPGCPDDYRALSKFHYRKASPGVVTNVIRLVHRGESALDRFLGRGEQMQIVGVLVRSRPALACALRDVATNGRYSGFAPSEAAARLNREVRTISRVVIHPQWRGLGLAVKLVRHALENPEDGIIFTEALAAMARVCPFFERAGMTRHDRPIRARKHDARLVDAMERSRTSGSSLELLRRELRRWHHSAHRTPPPQLSTMSLDELFSAARSVLAARPVYFVFQHDCSSHNM